jgi:hypothetical protein
VKRERLTGRQERVSLPHPRSDPTWASGRTRTCNVRTRGKARAVRLVLPWSIAARSGRLCPPGGLMLTWAVKRKCQAGWSVASINPAVRLAGPRGAGTRGRLATRPHRVRARSSPRRRPRRRAPPCTFTGPFSEWDLRLIPRPSIPAGSPLTSCCGPTPTSACGWYSGGARRRGDPTACALPGRRPGRC